MDIKLFDTPPFIKFINNPDSVSLPQYHKYQS